MRIDHGGKERRLPDAWRAFDQHHPTGVRPSLQRGLDQTNRCGSFVQRRHSTAHPGGCYARGQRAADRSTP
jgi:hypothetical protein